MGVHAGYPPPASVGERYVQCARDHAARILQQADARVRASCLTKDLAGAIRRASVDEQKLEVPREALALHGPDAGRDMTLLVEYGNQHRAVHVSFLDERSASC